MGSMTVVLLVLLALLVLGGALLVRGRREAAAGSDQPAFPAPATPEPDEPAHGPGDAHGTQRFARNGHGDLHAAPEDAEAERP